jgi:hypothetical protein
MLFNKKIRFVVIFTTTIALVFIMLFIMPRGLLVDKEKMSAISIFEKLEKSKPSLEQCLLAVDGCSKNNGPSIQVENDFTYITTSHYELVGFDKKSDVLVLLHPEITKSNVSWRCYGYPTNKMPIKCNAIQSNH